MRRGIAILIVCALLLGGQGLAAQLWPSRAATFVTLGSNGWSDPTVGTWDPVTMTGTLTRDLSQGIQITAGGVVLDGAGHTLTGDGSSAGVYILKQMGVTVKNVNVRGFAYGIYLYSAHGNTLVGNTATGNRANGIYLYSSHDNTLAGNNANGNLGDGVLLQFSMGNTLTGNSASGNQHGLYLNMSGSSVLTGNTMAGNASDFRVDARWEGDYDQAIDTSNRVGAGGKPIYYLMNATGGTIDGASNAGVVYLVNCSDFTLRDLALAGNHVGVLLWNTHNTRLENIQATGNTIGFWLRNSSGITLDGNTAGEAGYAGIYLETSGGNTLTGNLVRGNRSFGLLMSEATNSEIYHNRFVGNSAHASVNGAGNRFSQPKPKGGNYWDNWTGPDSDDDGIVDAPYNFEFSQQDEYPWASPDAWEAPAAPVTPAPAPTAGPAFVTGGGWVNPPAASSAGKAHVEVTCRYAGGAEIPTGQVNFQLNGSKLHFQSTSFDWLVVDGGQAWCSGRGTVKGAGACRFVLAVADGGAKGTDRLRIKVWEEATGLLLYDSQPGADDWAAPEAVLGGGNITIHKG